MGHAEYGGGPAHDHSTGTQVAELTGPTTGEPDVAVELAAARRARSGWPAARRSQGYTLNGTSPGPTIEAQQGDLVQVTLTNDDVPRASPCTGTAWTCPTPRTASRA